MTETKLNIPTTGKLSASVICLLIATSGVIARADDRPSAYVMNVIADQAQGERMMSGEYLQAVETINSKKQRDGFASSNNLCVAYTKLNDLDKAGQACADALQVRKSIFGPGRNSSGLQRDRAVALSNRGVIRAIIGDPDGARSDFLEALKLNDKLAAAADNLALLDNQDRRTASSL